MGLKEQIDDFDISEGKKKSQKVIEIGDFQEMLTTKQKIQDPCQIYKKIIFAISKC